MDKFKVPGFEIESRKFNIQKKLQEKGIDGLFIVQRADLFYFSGTAQNGFLYMPAQGEPLLLIKKYMPRACQESSIKNIVEIRSVKDVPKRIIDFFGRIPDVIGFEFDVIPVRDFYFYRSLIKAKEYVDGSEAILEVRMIKSDWEIEQIENTADMSCKTFEYMRTAISPGLTEMEFSGMYETFARKLGHGGKLRTRDYLSEVYPWHILSGESGGIVGLLDSPASGWGTSAAFPSGAGHRCLCSGEPIMIDFGSVLNGYHMDETRMFAIDFMPQRALSACQAVIEIHNSVIEKAKPGVCVNDLFIHASSLAESLGYADSWLGTVKYKVNFIGHGIGVELVEPPFIAKNKTDILKPGMVFALEPKMVFENEFSAGIESVFTITETGSHLITKIPAEVFIKK